jgi:hypothetical protein
MAIVLQMPGIRRRRCRLGKERLCSGHLVWGFHQTPGNNRKRTLPAYSR